jgi:hypothetical protein
MARVAARPGEFGTAADKLASSFPGGREKRWSKAKKIHLPRNLFFHRQGWGQARNIKVKFLGRIPEQDGEGYAGSVRRLGVCLTYEKTTDHSRSG